MKKTFIFIFMVGTLTFAPALTLAEESAPLPSDKEILATQDPSPLLRVNGQEVPRWMFENALRDRLRQHQTSAAQLAPQELAGHQREILSNLVLMEALEQESERHDLAVSMAGGALRSQIIRGRYKSHEDFLRALAKAGMTEKQFAVIWRQQASANRFLDEKILADVGVSEPEVRARFVKDSAKYPGATYEDIRDQLVGVMLEERRQAAFARYKIELLARTEVEVLDPALAASVETGHGG